MGISAHTETIKNMVALLLTPVILAVWKAEIGRIEVQDQSGQIVHETSSLE
jgi:hypothetical protein